MTAVKGYLIQRDGRELFLRDIPEWAISDVEYKVTTLVAYDDSLEVLLMEVREDRDLYTEICTMLDEENRELKAKIKELQEK